MRAFVFSFNILCKSLCAVSRMFAKLTKAACSTIASTAKSLAESDGIIVISSLTVKNSAFGLNEYSAYINQGLSATVNLSFPRRVLEKPRRNCPKLMGMEQRSHPDEHLLIILNQYENR